MEGTLSEHVKLDNLTVSCHRPMEFYKVNRIIEVRGISNGMIKV